MFSINQQAVKIVKEKIIPYAEQLNCKVIKLENGATVIDMGVNAPGGWLAGKLCTEVSLGGLCYVNFGNFSVGEITLPSIDVYIDQPQIACLSSQFSSWDMPGRDIPNYINPMGGGPARAIARNDFFSQLWDYQDIHHEAVLVAQIDEIPDESLAEQIAGECKIPVENVYILAARTGSLVSSIQICSRTIETSIWVLKYRGFDLKKVLTGMGTAPVAPPIKDEFGAMVRVNTAVYYGGTVRYIVDCEDKEIEAIIDILPISTQKRYEEPFAVLFEESGRKIFNTDKDIHTMARYEITNFATGRTFVAGEVNEKMLKDALF